MESSKKKKSTVEDLGPENLPDDAQVGVSYIEFDLLDALPASFDLKSMTATLLDIDDWKQQYDALNVLRSINKYQRETFLGSCEEEDSLLSKVIAPFLAQQVDNLRSNISKCALMLVKEIYMQGAAAT